MYFIWSIERGMWWKPDRRGYTTSRANAGTYKLSEAKEICRVNHGTADDAVPTETIVPFYE